MLEVLKLPSDLREAVVFYNRSLISSCLAAYILQTSLQSKGVYGHVTVMPYHSHYKSADIPFNVEKHSRELDLFLVGVEGYNGSLMDYLRAESITSLTAFPIAINAAIEFFEYLKTEREAERLPKGVQVTLVYDKYRGNLPAVVQHWCTTEGMVPGPHTKAFVGGYTRICEGKTKANDQASEDGNLADVYYRCCVAQTPLRASVSYEDQLAAFNEQLSAFSELMQFGFDSWVARGIETVERSRDGLQGNLLMSTLSTNNVVMAPNTKDEGFKLGYLLRKKYPQSLALVLFHQNQQGEYIYRVMRGARNIGNPFSILANVSPMGKAQAVMTSSLSPERVQRIADAAMAEQVKPFAKRA